MSTLSLADAYLHGASHIAVVEAAPFFECANCGADVAEPTDLQVVIEWTKNPERIACEDCEWIALDFSDPEVAQEYAWRIEPEIKTDHLKPLWMDELEDTDEDAFNLFGSAYVYAPNEYGFSQD